MTQLEEIFAELGLSQYLNTLEDQGFDTWETILDITESDLDALGVKLGHRRKLQRRIANYRGIAPDVLLHSPTHASVEDSRQDGSRPSNGKVEIRNGTTAPKRKYRRHPKPDENAPERPPSAYVLFSNKMREDLKGRNLSFTEIAKLVGENWQSLSVVEKKSYETEANQAKERYHQELSEYKKTPQYREYTEYLEEFRKRHASGANEIDSSKRVKADGSHTRASSSSGVGVNGSASGAASGTESAHGSEPPSQRQRMSSVASVPESQLSTAYSQSADEPTHGDFVDASRSQGLVSPRSHGRPAAWPESHRHSGDMSSSGNIPWLPGISDGRVGPPLSSIPAGQDASAFAQGSLPSLSGMHTSRSRTDSGSTPHLSRPPSLRNQASSSGSISSGGSFTPRTPSEAPLPIHALLSKPEPNGVSLPPLASTPLPIQYPLANDYVSRPVGHHPQMPYSPSQPPLSALDKGNFSGSDLSSTATPTAPGPGSTLGLDALLKAGEIVNQQQQGR